MLWHDRVLACVLAPALLVAGCKCASGTAPAASAKPSASASPLAVLAASVASSAKSARKTPADLVTPPLSPPEDAEHGPAGIRWKLVQRGSGAALGQQDGVKAEASFWTQAGELAFSTYAKPGPGGFSGATLPPALFTVLSPIPPGSKAWIWLPAEYVHSVRQQRVTFPFPDAALVIEYEPVEVHQASVPVVAASPAPEGLSTPASPFPAPDAAGPPKSALTTAGGLRYVLLAPGEGKAKPQPDDKLSLKFTLWPVVGLVVDNPQIRDYPGVTTTQRAPGGLGQVLQKMSAGSTARVWLSAGKAKDLVPRAPQGEAVLDLRLERIE
jgi:hypothetical protein